MIGALLPRPTGTSPEAQFAQSLWDGRERTVTQAISGQGVNRTTRGTYATPQKQSNTQGASVSCYRLKSVADKWVVARSWNGTDEGTTDVKIAKEHKIRTSINAEVIYGATHTYTYAAGADDLNKVRTHTLDAATQDEIVVPPWTPDEVIFAISAQTDVSDGDGNKIRLLMVGRSAQWARI